MKITKDIIALLIIIAGLVSLFIPVDQTGAEIIRALSSLVIGYYFGVKNLPIIGSFIKNKGRKK